HTCREAFMFRSVRSRCCALLVPGVIALSVCLLPTRGAHATRSPLQPAPEALSPLMYHNASVYTGQGVAPIDNAFVALNAYRTAAAFRGIADMKRLPALPFESRGQAGGVDIPGLTDPPSPIGVSPRRGLAAHSDGNEMSGPVQPGVRAIDSIFPDDPGIRMAVA